MTASLSKVVSKDRFGIWIIREQHRPAKSLLKIATRRLEWVRKADRKAG